MEAVSALDIRADKENSFRKVKERVYILHLHSLKSKVRGGEGANAV
jgi:hypothetical protein